MKFFIWQIILLTGLNTIAMSQRFPTPGIRNQAISPSISKQTFLYAVKDSNKLGLDVYMMKNTDTPAKKPCVIFVFGGAFVTGDRDDSVYNGYFNFLAEHGYIVVSISYRLGLKGVRHVSKFSIKPLVNALNMAIDDVFDATNWVINHSAELGIDSSEILLSGSSSGAITVLTAEFEKANEYEAAAKIPAAF